MDFKEIMIGELQSLIESEWFSNSSDIPITTHRALSQLHNPRASEEDICLIIALNEEEELLGYIGILPDHFASNSEHVGWLSCCWVHPEKGKKIGLNLFLQALIVWDYKFIITDFTPHLKRLVSKTNMFSFAPIQQGIRGFIGFNLAEILPRKKTRLKKFKGLLEVMDFSLNLTNSIRLLFVKRKYSGHGLEISFPKTIDEQLSTFISGHQETEYFKRSAAELNWILQHPWVLEQDGIAQSEGKKYYFSSTEKIFRYYCLSFTKEGKIVGFAILRQRNQTFTLPYIYFSDDHLPNILKAVYEFLLKKKATEITVFQKDVVKSTAQNDTPFLYKRSIPKDFAVAKKLEEHLTEEGLLQDGDGDYAFT